MPEASPPLVDRGDKASRPRATWLTVQHGVKTLKSSRVHEIAISAMVVAIVAIGVVWSLSDSAIRRAAVPILEPIAVPIGLDQNWSMYAPTPPLRQENVEVHVAMADGNVKVWTLPRLNPIFGVSLSHRWRKVKESLLTDAQTRPGFAHWVVRELTGPGDHPVQVDMLLRTENLPPPGVRGPGAAAAQALYSRS